MGVTLEVIKDNWNHTDVKITKSYLQETIDLQEGLKH